MEYIVNKSKQVSVYKPFGNIAVLPYRFKQQRRGAWIYLPSQLIDVLGIQHGKDGDLLVLVIDDLDLSNNFLVLTKDDFVLDRLRPQLLNLKQQSIDKLGIAKKTAGASTESTADLSLQRYD